MFEGIIYSVGDEVIAWDDTEQAPAYGIILAIDLTRNLYAVRIPTDIGCVAIPTTFECIAELNKS